MEKIEKFKNLSKVTKVWARLSKATSFTAQEFIEAGRRIRIVMIDYNRSLKVMEAKRLHDIGHRIRMTIIHWDLTLK